MALRTEGTAAESTKPPARRASRSSHLYWPLDEVCARPVSDLIIAPVATTGGGGVSSRKVRILTRTRDARVRVRTTRRTETFPVLEPRTPLIPPAPEVHGRQFNWGRARRPRYVLSLRHRSTCLRRTSGCDICMLTSRLRAMPKSHGRGGLVAGPGTGFETAACVLQGVRISAAASARRDSCVLHTSHPLYPPFCLVPFSFLSPSPSLSPSP